MSAPVDRCAANVRLEQPLVTEWSASDKSHLEGLMATQAIAVRYSGCELRIVDGCRMSGRYAYRRTTLSSDATEIKSDDELFAKLPVGALGLEGELDRSGRLVVRTTVGGHYWLEGAPAIASTEGACAEATHLVTGISVGSFSLLSGGREGAGAGVSAVGVGAGVRTAREESLVRQAGDPAQCSQGDGQQPHPLCASPVQLFLTRLGGASGQRPADTRLVEERRAREQGVLIDIPRPSWGGGVWKLHNSDGQALCTAPCSSWVPLRGGYYLERTPSSSAEGVRIDLPNDLPYSPGTHLKARYAPERGLPFLSKLTFYGVGIPAGGLSLGLGIAYLASDSDSRLKGFFLGGSIFYGVFAAASTWWFIYSDDKHFRVDETGTASLLRPVRLGLSPGGLQGTFW